jgi:hypothetical protein
MNQLKQHKLLTLPVAMAMVMVMVLAVMALGTADRAEANHGTAGCAVDFGTTLTGFLQATNTLATDATYGDTLEYEVVVSVGSNQCPISGGEPLLTLPNGVTVDLANNLTLEPNQSATFNSTTNPHSYTVNPADQGTQGAAPTDVRASVTVPAISHRRAPAPNQPVTNVRTFDTTVVDAAISIAPATDTNPVGTNHTLTITVVSQNGDLGNGTATAVKDSGPGSFVGPDTCNYTGGVSVTSANCDVVITSAVAGITVVSASSNISVEGVSISRSTDGTTTPGGLINSGPAEKEWIPLETTLVTDPNPDAAEVGDTLHDSATLSGGLEPVGGTITFKLYAPGDPNCQGAAAHTEIVQVAGNGTYNTVLGFVANQAGTWNWTAAYSGDPANKASESPCGEEPVVVEEPPAEFTGCTPGFWKTHTDIWDSATPTDIAPTFDPDTLMSVALGFNDTVPAQGKQNPAVLFSELTMEDALGLGGGNLRALVRHSAAALLNADSQSFPFSVGAIQTLVQNAFANNDANFDNALSDLASANEIGCGFDAHGNPI